MIKIGESLALTFQAFVKDYMHRSDDHSYYLVHFVSTEMDSFLPGDISPAEYLASEGIRDKVDEWFEILQRTKVWIEAGIKRTGDGKLQVVKTELNI